MSRAPARTLRAGRSAEPGSIELLRAAVEFDRDGQMRVPRFALMAYTGVELRGVFKGQKLPIVVDLAGMQVPRSTVPVLKDHNPALIVGHTTQIENTGRDVRVTGLASGAGQVSQEVIQSAKDGFPWQASITAAFGDVEEVRKGQRVLVNGREFTGPVLIARSSRIKEVSFVALGADDNTTAAIAAKESTMTFEAWLKAKGWGEVSELTSEQEQTLRAAFEAELQASAEGETEDADANLDSELEPTRITGRKKAKATKKRAKAKASKEPVRKLAASGAAAGEGDDDAGDGGETAVLEAGDDPDAPAVLTRADLQAERERVAGIERRLDAADPRVRTIRAQAIRDGWTADKAELAALRATRPQIAPTRDRNAPAQGEVLEAALGRGIGLSASFMEAQFDERVLEAADDRGLRDLGVQGLLYEVIRASGRSVRAGSFGVHTLRAAVDAEQELRASGFSTISVSGILSNLANKALLQTFMSFKSVAEQICSIGNVRDFKRHTRYRLTGRGGFTKVGPAGELKHTRLGEESYGIQADTYGEMLTLTRQDIINDDLGALTSKAQILGRDAFIKREELVFTVLLDNSGDFFSEANANLLEGTDTVLSISALTIAMQMFLDQVDEARKPIMVEPKFLLVPNATATLAGQIAKDTMITQFNDDGEARPASNPHAGKVIPLASPYMNNAAIAGGSATHWMLLADPMQVSAIELAYLRGQRNPTIEQDETQFNMLGLQTRAFWDLGVEKQDHRGAVKVTGVTAEE
jgi:hypothetical protein